MKSVAAAIATAAIVIASTTAMMAQNPPAAPGVADSSVTRPALTKAARPHHKKNQSLAKRLRNSVQKKLAKFTAPKKHASPGRSTAPGKTIPQSQIE